MLFEKRFEKGRRVEVVLNRALAATGDDDDVLYAGGYAFFGDVLDLRFVDNSQHFLRLGLCGRQKARAQASGGQNCLSFFSWRGGGGRRISVCCWPYVLAGASRRDVELPLS